MSILISEAGVIPYNEIHEDQDGSVYVDMDGDRYELSARQIIDILVETDQMCEECMNTGEITVMEPVYKGEPHMAAIGARPCPFCSQRVTEEDYEEE